MSKSAVQVNMTAYISSFDQYRFLRVERLLMPRANEILLEPRAELILMATRADEILLATRADEIILATRVWIAIHLIH
jgi:hypothetical protein